MTNQGVVKDTLKVGDTLIVTANPARSTEDSTRALLKTIRRPAAPTGEPAWQGYSVAAWLAPQLVGAGGGGGGRGRGSRPATTLKVVTTHMRPGYLRKNGVPYSGNAGVPHQLLGDWASSQYGL